MGKKSNRDFDTGHTIAHSRRVASSGGDGGSGGGTRRARGGKGSAATRHQGKHSHHTIAVDGYPTQLDAEATIEGGTAFPVPLAMWVGKQTQSHGAIINDEQHSLPDTDTSMLRHGIIPPLSPSLGL